MPTDNPIGLMIRRARERKRLTQEQLANVLGVNRSTVATWESGESFPLRTAGAIEAALDITIPEPPKAEPEKASA